MIDAFGKVYFASALPFRVVLVGGPSGSAWPPFSPSCHWYSAGPRVTHSTDALKWRACFVPPSANSIFTAWSLSRSLLISITDHCPSGRSSAYAVTSRLPASSVTSLATLNRRRGGSARCPHPIVITCAARYCGG